MPVPYNIFSPISHLNLPKMTAREWFAMERSSLIKQSRPQTSTGRKMLLPARITIHSKSTVTIYQSVVIVQSLLRTSNHTLHSFQ